jgi:hypothetical protein
MNQASAARHELGALRDARYVYPALQSKSYKARLVGVACLAFLDCKHGSEMVKKAAKTDVDATVRRAALWACGFAGGSEIDVLASQLAETDPDPSVRSFAARLVGLDSKGWWRV